MFDKCLFSAFVGYIWVLLMASNTLLRINAFQKILRWWRRVNHCHERPFGISAGSAIRRSARKPPAQLPEIHQFCAVRCIYFANTFAFSWNASHYERSLKSSFPAKRNVYVNSRHINCDIFGPRFPVLPLVGSFSREICMCNVSSLPCAWDGGQWCRYNFNVNLTYHFVIL